MSGNVVDLLVIVGGLVVVAAGVIVLTRRRRPAAEPPPEPRVRWMLPSTTWFAHAFYAADLEHFDTVSPVAHCGTWPVDDLAPAPDPPVPTPDVPRCTPCTETVERIARRR